MNHAAHYNIQFLYAWYTALLCYSHEYIHGPCSEFIQLLSSEANEVATKEKKNTIQPEHVISALKELGFEGKGFSSALFCFVC